LAQTVEGAHHDFGLQQVHARSVLAQEAHIRSPGPRQQSGTGRQPSGTDHTVVTPDDRHVTVKALVRIDRSFWQGRSYLLWVKVHRMIMGA
jgi:hypothetical protein